MKTVVAIATTFFLLTGCAVNRWEQSGKTSVQIEEDSFSCENQLEKQADWDKLAAKERDRQREQCMVDKGYRRVS